MCKQCGIKFYYKEIRILGQIELFIFNGVKVFQEFGFDIIILLDVGFRECWFCVRYVVCWNDFIIIVVYGVQCLLYVQGILVERVLEFVM